MSFNVGENVGPYRIIEQLGQGGMATVYKAYHASLDRYVAIKALHPAFSEDVSFESRFRREARVVAKLEHPNIVPIYDYAEHEKRPYLVMKFIEGNTLKAELDKGPLSSQDLLRVVEAVGAALAYAHKQGILHRDVKPSNVLLATDGQIYLADFGLARIAQSGESTLSSDTVMGTPQYISPEQAMGIRELDERTDVYSFGVMLYEIVVGKVPFSADTPFSIIHDHIYTPLPLPRKVNPGVSEQVERVLLKALAKDRLDRYEHVDQMVAAFKDAWTQAAVPTQTAFSTRAGMRQAVQAAQSEGPTAESVKISTRPIPVRQGSAPARKRSLWIWIGAGLLLLCCLGFTARAIRNRSSLPLVKDLRATNSAPTALPQRLDNPLPPEVRAAQDLANSDPNNLEHQFELALVYWNSDMPEETYATLNRVIDLAGPDKVDFYIPAGDKFLAMQAWPPAAILYFKAVEFYAAQGKIPADVLDRFHEAVYKSADHPAALRPLPFDEIAKVDEPIALILRARSALYAKDLAEAQRRLDEVKKLKPGMPEAVLLEAEINAMDGKAEQAKILLNSLGSNSSIPPWIRVFADQIMKRLP